MTTVQGKQDDRVADALFRGVYAQVLIAALEWIKLPKGSALYIERVEDVDIIDQVRSASGEPGDVTTHVQVKQFDQNVSARTPDVLYSIAQFARSFLVARNNQKPCRFVFTTSAGRARQQTASESAKVVLDVDVLKVWSGVDGSTHLDTLIDLWGNLRALFLGNMEALTLRGARFEPVLRELDQNNCWEEFVKAVSWRFDHGEIVALKERLLSAMRSDFRMSAVLNSTPLEYLVRTMIVEIIEKAGNSEVEMRRFDRLSFARLVAQATLTLDVEKVGSVDLYRNYLYLEFPRGERVVLCLLRLSSIEFVEAEAATFLSTTNTELQGFGRASVNNLCDILGSPETILHLSQWLRLMPIAIYVSVVQSGSAVKISRSNLSRTVGFELGKLFEFFADVVGPGKEHSECSAGPLVDIGCTSYPRVLSLARLVGHIVASRLLNEVGDATRLYESIRYKVQVAIDPEVRVFSEPNRPVP